MNENKVGESETPVEETKTSDGEKERDGGTDRTERTEREKAEYNLRRNADKVKELGGDPSLIIGKTLPKVDENLPDDAPLTVGAYRELQKQDAKKTAIQLADRIEDADEREKVKSLLKNRFIPSGDPHADLALARSAINAERTTQLAEELARKRGADRNAAGGSADANKEEEFTPTEQESVFMNPPYKLTKEQILAARAKVQQQ